MFAHIFGPLTLDPFIKQIKIAAKAQPGIPRVLATSQQLAPPENAE